MAELERVLEGIERIDTKVEKLDRRPESSS